MSRKRRALSDRAAAVLALFVENPDSELHGFDILKRSGAGSGSLYPILDRFESFSWLSSRWEDGSRGENGPRRRVYRLNPDRRGEAQDALQTWKEMQRRPDSPAHRGPRPAEAPS